MSSVVPILLMGLAGVLVGGAWSLRKQGSSKTSIVITAALALVSLAAGVLWLLPGGD